MKSKTLALASPAIQTGALAGSAPKPARAEPMRTPEEREAFLKDLHAFFLSRGLAVVPTYEGEVSFHDAMTVVEYDGATQEYVQNTYPILEG